MVVDPHRVPRPVLRIADQITHDVPLTIGRDAYQIQAPALRDEDSELQCLGHPRHTTPGREIPPSG